MQAVACPRRGEKGQEAGKYFQKNTVMFLPEQFMRAFLNAKTSELCQERICIFVLLWSFVLYVLSASYD